MDAPRFDDLTRTLTSAAARRGVVRRFVGAGLGLVALRSSGALAAKKRQKRKKPLQTNAYGCVDVSKPCRGKDANCCSGICEGRKPKKGEKDKSRCVAHNVLDCQADQDFCVSLYQPCGGGTGLYCFRTTGNASYCGTPAKICTVCRTDAECEAIQGPGAACVVCAHCTATGGTACATASV
jgi:hypothetical protein